jgi:hypothetical protein
MLDESLYATGDDRKMLKDKRRKRVAWLRKKGKKSPASGKLADKLEGCKKGRRCKSAACAECAHAAQRLLTKVTRRFLKAGVNDGTIVCVTVVPADGITKPGNLNKGEHERRIRRWKEKLGKGGITWFAGATDWSYNQHKQGKHKSVWFEHIHGITLTKNPKKLKKKLREQFPKTGLIARPVTVVAWDGDPKALRYILKPQFRRRIANDHGKRHDKNSATTRVCRDTDTQPLQSKQKQELLLHLDDTGIQARLVMRRCQVLNLKGQGPAIVIRSPKSKH